VRDPQQMQPIMDQFEAMSEQSRKKKY